MWAQVQHSSQCFVMKRQIFSKIDLATCVSKVFKVDKNLVDAGQTTILLQAKLQQGLLNMTTESQTIVDINTQHLNLINITHHFSTKTRQINPYFSKDNLLRLPGLKLRLPLKKIGS